MIKVLIGLALMLASFAAGLYIGGWMMFVQPILEVCKALDAGTVSFYLIGVTVLKCIFSIFVGGFVAFTGISIASFFLDD